MSEMLDIMAKAMRELSLTTDRCPAPETYSLLIWREFAREALMSLRKPTEAMLDAGTRGGHVGEYVGPDGVARHTDAERVWFPMIDEALK